MDFLFIVAGVMVISGLFGALGIPLLIHLAAWWDEWLDDHL